MQDKRNWDRSVILDKSCGRDLLLDLFLGEYGRHWFRKAYYGQAAVAKRHPKKRIEATSLGLAELGCNSSSVLGNKVASGSQSRFFEKGVAPNALDTITL